jgi:DNA-binding NarL/FixJ family response regulator
LIRTLIVSDVRLYREGLAELLAGQRRIAVVASLAYCESDVEQAERLRPDVVLLDVAGPGRQGVLRRFVDGLPEARVLALTVAETDAEIIACAEAGVSGLVTRASSLQELIGAVESVQRGETLCSPLVAAVLLQRVHELSGRGELDGAVYRLTAREREILELAGGGLSNKEIARRSSIELSTVKNHMHSILDKLGVHRREEAAALLGAPSRPGVSGGNGRGI